MKLYKGRRAKYRIDRRIQNRISDRDAIIWSVEESQHYAYVKIQGTNAQVKAHFPRNWDYMPYWLKPGCSVRIRHRQGNRGYIEIIGQGRAVPTALSGSSLPDVETSDLEDGILTGIEVTPTIPPSMAVEVSSGTFRVDGSTYTFDGESNSSQLMQDPTSITMDDTDPITMGEGSHIVEIDDPLENTVGYCDGGQGRVDILVIGADGGVDYIKGDTYWLDDEDIDETGPPVPDVPADHILVDTIFVKTETTEIIKSDIGFEWTARTPTSIKMYGNCPGCMCPGGNGACLYNSQTEEWIWPLWPIPCSLWYLSPALCTISLLVKDQYGVCMESMEGSTVLVKFQYGNGVLCLTSECAHYVLSDYIEVGEEMSVSIDDEGIAKFAHSFVQGECVYPIYEVEVYGYPRTRRSITYNFPCGPLLTTSTTTT